MCYSAQITASIKKLRRRFPVEIDYRQTEILFEQRLEDPRMRIARTFEDNFMAPENEVEERIKALIDTHRARLESDWQQELFKAKKRLADAERKLKVKVTKTAQNEVRIASNKIEDLTRRLADLDRVEPKARDERIFPRHCTGVMIQDRGRYLLTPMRYLCRPEGKPAFFDEKFPGLYNARRDNLEKFWAGQFGRRHAIAIVESFFENVKHHDLEGRELRPGEKPKNLILQFAPRSSEPMLVACLWSHWTSPGANDLRSFAIITDDPPREVAAAGHDRCPINLKPQHVDDWLSPERSSVAALQSLLSDREAVYYDHEVLQAA